MLKAGLIGCGNICGAYLRNNAVFPHVRIVKCASKGGESARAAAEEFGLRAVTVDELLRDPEIDVILNLTIPEVHVELNLRALEAGKHVYTEKPFAITREDARKVLRAASERGLRVGCAPDTFLGGGHQTCRKLIDEGLIGEIVGASGAMICRGHETWHPDPEFYYTYGGGPMLDMGPYYVTALINLMGRVSKVTGVTKISFPERTITSQPLAGTVIHVSAPTYITGVLHFESGAIANLTTTFDVYKSDSHDIEIYGSKGTLFVPDPNGFCGPVRFYDGETKEMKEFPLEFDYDENSRALGLADMAKAIETGRAPRASYKQTFHVLEVMQAFEKSSKEGRTVEIESPYERQIPMNPASVHGILD